MTLQVQSSQAPSAQADGLQAARLAQFKSDVLVFVDLVSKKSSVPELTTREEIFTQFCEKAPAVEPPRIKDLQSETEKTVAEQLGLPKSDPEHPVKHISPRKLSPEEREVVLSKVPSTKEQRKIFSRREMLMALLDGRMSEVEAKAKEIEEQQAKQPQGEKREITREYFDTVVDAALKDSFGVAEFTAWNGKKFLHYRPLLSGSYARMMSAQENPVALVVQTVRENSRLYPRPVSIGSFQDPPFSLSEQTIKQVLEVIAKDPQCKDICYCESSVGNMFLYSRDYLDDAYADFLAEGIDVAPYVGP